MVLGRRIELHPPLAWRPRARTGLVTIAAYLLDNSMTETDLGWRPRVPFGDSLTAAVPSYADHRDWRRVKTERLRNDLDDFAWRR